MRVSIYIVITYEFRGKTSLTRIHCVKLRLIEPTRYAFLVTIDCIDPVSLDRLPAFEESLDLSKKDFALKVCIVQITLKLVHCMHAIMIDRLKSILIFLHYLH